VVDVVVQQAEGSDYSPGHPAGNQGLQGQLAHAKGAQGVNVVKQRW
jgi:hypothetical protein